MFRGNNKTAALLVIDVQQGLFGKSTPIYKAEEILQNITTLIDRAHQAGTPVIYIQHSDQRGLIKDSPDWQLHSRLQPLETDTLIHKQHGNAFEETNLQDVLQSKNIHSLVITGLVTHGCFKATCIGALELGYRVIAVKDAHSSYSDQAASLIEKWNANLSAMNAELKATSEVQFS